MAPASLAGWSKRPPSAATASEEANRIFLPYGEHLSDARTKLEDVFNILLENKSKKPSHAFGLEY
ncbi:MAG: hypothetical protein A4E19_07590 [Nitrospira sp. SG-bin1]|nr:MAG: hypothetical protein A4E19_07590 [Nitrospira sp. SG-bin1]